MKSRILAAPMLGALFLGLLAASASADPVTHGDLLSDGYVRAMPPNAPVAGGYVTIANKGSQEDRLVAACSTRAGELQIHEMTRKGDVMKMRELPDGLPVPAGGSVELKPGGYLPDVHAGADPLCRGRYRRDDTGLRESGRNRPAVRGARHECHTRRRPGPYL